MTKNKIVKKMTIGGFILYLFLCVLRMIVTSFISVSITVLSLFAIVPLIQIIIYKDSLLSDIINMICGMYEESLWDRCKTEYKIVKQTKIIEEVLKRV